MIPTRREGPQELGELFVQDAAALRAWLAEHHATSPGVWLALTKKGGTTTSITWRKIGKFVAMLARQETIHPQKARPG